MVKKRSTIMNVTNIIEDTTLTVGASGANFTTIQAALDFLNDKWINPTAIVTILIADGTYTLTSPIIQTHQCGSQIKIVGTNTYSKSMTSVQSSSGGSGAWTIIINIAVNVNLIAVNDYVLISGAAGGSNPTYILGCHKVTNVDVANSRITVASKHINASAPSGNVTATVL